MTTIREHLEAIRETALRENASAAISNHAVLALNKLDRSKKTFGKYEGRLVLDPATEEAKP